MLCIKCSVAQLAGPICFAFVFTGALLLSITAALFIVGLCWSCTRGWAALVLIVLSAVGNLMLFGGIIGLIIYLAILGGACYAYFYWAPNYYKEQGQEKPDWLQVRLLILLPLCPNGLYFARACVLLRPSWEALCLTSAVWHTEPSCVGIQVRVRQMHTVGGQSL